MLVIAVPGGMLVLLVGFSRTALGAHFLTDVLAAIFLGITWLILCTVFRNSVALRTVASAISGSPV
jgi:undecaprenyl-diphosphatase